MYGFMFEHRQMVEVIYDLFSFIFMKIYIEVQIVFGNFSSNRMSQATCQNTLSHITCEICLGHLHIYNIPEEICLYVVPQLP